MKIKSIRILALLLMLSLVIGIVSAMAAVEGVTGPTVDQWGHMIPYERDPDGNLVPANIGETKSHYDGRLYPNGVYKLSPTMTTVFFDGTPSDITTFIIRNNNYVRIRDVAKVLDIGVGWLDYCVVIDSSESYDGLPTNVDTPNPIGYYQAALSTTPLRVVTDRVVNDIDGFTGIDWFYVCEDIYAPIYMIGSNNYIQLRALADILDLGIAYNAETKNVYVDTERDYDANATIADLRPVDEGAALPKK